ncbi:HIRA-interacting protein 3 isoform X2 [Emydura macquarii macquarii]|uniref:HIRA-interacting protein 3 isoform X2 n=1 Tax=Emydura macquarii macquarii TaxID=1129001 RepID=UPI00352A61BD
MAAEREMRDFTRGLFQCSPDLSVLTLSMVRTKYLAHVGRESLVPEEKQLLKQLVEEELLTMQLGESSGDEESPTPKSAQDTPEAQAQKRPWRGSNSSGGSPKEMARKKQRLNRDSENSSDGEDSGIDSRKTKLAPARRDAGKCGRARSWEDEGDSGAEETPDRGGSGSDSDSEGGARSQGMKQPPRRRTGEAKGQDRAGKKRARVAEWRGDCREQKGKEDRGTVAQIEEESGSKSEVEEECKQQEQTGKKGAMKAEQRDDSEEEEGDSKKKGTMKAWGKEARNDSEEERKSRKQGTRKAERRGDSEEEESEGERKSRKETGKKGARNAEQGSDSEEEESKQRLKAGEEERKSRKQGVRKAQWRGDSEEEGDSKKKRRRMKARGKESGSDSEEDKEERKGRRQAGKKGVRKAGRWNDSEDEDKNKTKAQRKEGLGCAEERKWQKQMGKKGMGKAERWSDSEDEEGGTKKRRGKESGSESEEERKSRKQAGKQGARKAERRGDSKEEESKQRLKAGEEEEESGSESEGERKSRKETGKKGARKAEQDSDSEEEESKLKAGEEEESGSEREECEVQAKKKGSSKSDGDSSSSSSSAQGENNSPNHGSRHKKGKAPGEHPAVQRLKRYILACGVRRNYKKLLGTCRSVKERVRVLRRELEAIGLQGNPSLERCRALRQHREEAAEVAALDMGNIIASEGRPRRRNVWSLYSAPPAVPPSPDRKPPAQHPVDWSSLRGIISSDGESD